MLKSILAGFNDDGIPFLPETRTSIQLERLEQIHKGILDYVLESGIRYETARYVTKELPNFMVHFIGEEYSVVNEICFEGEGLINEFANWKDVTTNIKKLDFNNLISHRYPFDDLDRVFAVMHGRREKRCKVIVNV